MKEWIEEFGGLKRLNTVTKYPSIPTFHEIQGKGQLVEGNFRVLVNEPGYVGEPDYFDPAEAVYGYEKVDGTNSRIIFLPCGGYIIGSREELLYAKGDVIHNSQMNIVDAVKETADNFNHRLSNHITVLYLESYGKGIGKASKQYTTSGKIGIRAFDMCAINLDLIKGHDIQKLSSWRETNNGTSYQKFTPVDLFNKAMYEAEIQTAPNLFALPATSLPTTLTGMMEFLKEQIPESMVALDEGAPKKPEGFVVRNKDRSAIAKVRYEDYERTLKRRK